MSTSLNLPIAPTNASTGSVFGSLASLPQNSAPAVGGQNVDAVAKDFEAVFLSQMMEPMFSGDSTSSYFGGGAAGDIYKSFMMDAYGKSIAQAGGIGIAAQVKKELLGLQEVKS
jgi:Rod binding domain-containing protein